MRCDLHVHSRHSGPATLPLLRHLCDESHSDPQAVYETARRRGMDLVTITDHDTIVGALEIAGRPDTFVSEEVTCLLSGGRELHIGVFDLDLRQHEAIARKRRDPEALFAYLAEEKLPAALNHPFSALTGARETRDLHLAFDNLRLVECLNGMLPEATNRAADEVASWRRMGRIGGSDSHTLANVARACTAVPRARSKAEFVDGLRRRQTLPLGRSGTYARFTSDIGRIALQNLRERARECGQGARAALRFAALVALAPFLPLMPLVSALVLVDENRFAARHFTEFARAAGVPARASLALPARLAGLSLMEPAP